MWIDARDALPLKDGYYLVQSVFGEITGMGYTVKGGWNTSYIGGELHSASKIADTYTARWLDAPSPAEVPQAWADEHLEEYRKGVSK